jgi:ParB family transcriptional regulator, chromosome partitioning protein
MQPTQSTQTKAVPKSQSAKKKALASPPMSKEELLEQTIEESQAEEPTGPRVLGTKPLFEYTEEDWPRAYVDAQRDNGKLPALSLIWLNPKLLQEDPENERGPVTQEADPELQTLALSIKERGVLEPLRVYRAGDATIIQSGHRRQQAAILAGLALVPCMIVPPPKGQLDQAIDRLTSNLQRKDLSPMEKAKSLKAMIDAHPITQVNLAERLGMSQGAIGNLLRILELPQPVQDLVANGKLTAGHAVALLAIKEPRLDWQGNQVKEVSEVIEEMAKSAADSGWSVRVTEANAKNHNQVQESHRKWAEEDRQRQVERQQREEEANRLVPGGENPDYLAPLKVYEQESTARYEICERNRAERGKQWPELRNSIVGWDPKEGPGIDQMRLTAMVLMDNFGFGDEKKKAKLKERVELARTLTEVLNIMAEVAVGRLSLDFQNYDLQTYGITPWAGSRFGGLKDKVLAAWKERGLIDPPVPAKPEPPKQEEPAEELAKAS